MNTDSALRNSQMQMAAYLRDPESAPAPEGVEDRRLKVYRELVFNNVEGFISGGFPVLRSLYGEAQWQELVRSFLQEHRCQSPYFLEISQEFIRYLMETHQPRDCDPPYIAELAHYEWVELALDVSEEELPQGELEGDIDTAVLRLSPLAWVLSYQYPVHRIGPDQQPNEPGEQTFLAVYRDREDNVQFMEINGATARLLELLRENTETDSSGVLARLAQEMGVEVDVIRGYALDQLQSLLQQSVIVPV